MRVQRLILSLAVGIAVYILFFFPSLSFAENECSIVFSLVSDTGEPVVNATMSAVELPHGTKISTKPAGLVQEVAVPLPNILYRKVEVIAKQENSSGKIEAGSVAFFNLWPCATAYKTTLTLSARTGDAREVRDMWESKDLVRPSDFATAALQYAQALGTAQARLKANPNSRHQYTLISTYLALRAFNNLNSLSNIPLAHCENLAKIATWHRNLLTKVRQDRLDVIFREGTKIANERLALANMYKKYWNKTIKIKNPEIVLKRLHRFRKALDSESNSNKILADIGLSQSEVYASITFYAGKITKQTPVLGKEVKDLIAEQIHVTEKFLQSEPVLKRDKLSADVRYLNQKIAD